VLKGKLSARNRRFFRSRGPVKRVRAIDAPTLLVQGTVDTLFTPQEAAANYRILRRAGTPVKMIWFCGGHGICSTEFGPRSPIEAPPDQVEYTRRVALRWFARHLKGRDVGTGSRFRWFADDGELRSARRYPREDRVLTGRGAGLLPLVEGGGADSGTLIAASPSNVAVNVPIRRARRSGDLLRPPRLTITYSGTATPRRTFVYAQLVKGDHVVSNQVSPVPLLLNGQKHTRRLRLEIPAARANRGTRYTLQLIPGTNVYFSQRASGAVRFHGVKLKLPVSRAH
jgi:ABC-2 type transport system ATP-binding protein